MKILIAAIALTIAVPAAAQTAQPAADPHAGHTMPAGHGQHGEGHEDHKKCCDKMADGKMMECCDKANADGGKMDCCEKHGQKAGAADAHAGHDMSKH